MARFFLAYQATVLFDRRLRVSRWSYPTKGVRGLPTKGVRGLEASKQTVRQEPG
jgi:hypothetical protein